MARRLGMALVFTFSASFAFADSPANLLDTYKTLAKGAGAAAGDVVRGQSFFNSTHGNEWKCASCHGAVPTGKGEHAITHKVIEPLAPAFNAQRFSDMAKTEKWFRRNCKDVLGRECSAAEKADVLAWLMTLK
jgi:mono/diheme cytochrome c family protein